MNEAPPVFTPTQAWKAEYGGAHAGVLAMRGLTNPKFSPPLEQKKRTLEAALQQRYAGLDRAALRADPILQIYAEYYKRFDKTYHVQLQLESVVLKGRPIPSAAALVEAMFMAELDSKLLTAGHDLDAILGSLILDVAKGTETYVLLRGDPQSPKAGDMMIRDARGILSSIIYGPDQRTQIRDETKAAVFTVYAPAGIPVDAIERHLKGLQENLQLIAPGVQTLLEEIHSA